MTKSQAHDHANTIWMYWHDDSSDNAEALKVIKEQKQKPPVYKLTRGIKSIKDSLVLSYLIETVLEF